jgi:predicted ATPase
VVLWERVRQPDRYPFNLPAVKFLREIEFHPRVTFIMGENGSGKSTLLESIAVECGFNAEGGSKHFEFSTRASHSPLHECLRLEKGIRRPRDGYFLRAESYFNVASEIERLDAEPAADPPIIAGYGGTSLHEQSHGESFLALLVHRLRGNGLYIFDEPEAALSPQRQLSVLARMHVLISKRSQFIIATHSPILMAYPDAWIYCCTPDGLKRIAYEETEHYRITRGFLNNPNGTLDVLFSNEDGLYD